MIEQLREALKPLMDMLSWPFLRWHPNTLTILTLLVGLPGFYFYATGNLLFGSLFIFGAIFDAIDGVVARKTGKKSAFGGILDASIDRIFDGILLMSIGIGNLAPWPVLFMCMIGSFSISYIKAKAETVSQVTSVGKNQYSVGFMQRGDRLGVIFILSIITSIFFSLESNVFAFGIIIMTILVWINVLYRLWAVYQTIREK